VQAGNNNRVLIDWIELLYEYVKKIKYQYLGLVGLVGLLGHKEKECQNQLNKDNHHLLPSSWMKRVLFVLVLTISYLSLLKNAIVNLVHI
jgi:hypothetical protein